MIRDLQGEVEYLFPKESLPIRLSYILEDTRKILLNIQRFKIYYPSTLTEILTQDIFHLTKNQKKELNHEESGGKKPCSKQCYYLN